VILIVEDNALSAMVLAQALHEAGGIPLLCGTAAEALRAIAQGGMAAGILDDSICKIEPEVCNQLDQRGLPYVVHAQLAEVHGAWAPVSGDAVVDQIATLLTHNF
jgi:hypothetical protein